MIQSELKYIIGAKNLGLQKPGFEVEPGPNATVQGFDVLKPLHRFGSRSNPNPEPLVTLVMHNTEQIMAQLP